MRHLVNAIEDEVSVRIRVQTEHFNIHIDGIEVACYDGAIGINGDGEIHVCVDILHFMR